jgi:hypothetical protein
MFLLQIENVDGIIENVGHLHLKTSHYYKGGCFFKLKVLLNLPLLFLIDMLQVFGGGFSF